MRFGWLVVLTIVLLSPVNSSELLSNFTLVRERKEQNCNGLKVNTAFALTTKRSEQRTSSKNLLDSFAVAATKFFLVDPSFSNIMGIIAPLILPIFFILAFIVTMIIFCMFMCQGYFITRKEYITLLKQRLFFYSTFVFIIVLAILFVLFSSSLQNSITQAKYSMCLYYWIQYDLMAGVNESPYTFIGFDNIEKTVNIFKSELRNFNTLLPNFKSISSKNINSIRSVPLASAYNYTLKYESNNILAYDESSTYNAIPVPVESLTTFISTEIEKEFRNINYVSNNVTTMVDSGIEIVTKYNTQSDVLITSVVTAMNYINDSFRYIMDKLLSFEDPLEQLIKYMRIANVVLVLLAIAVFCFLPVFIAFYILRNTSDKYVWMVKTAKTVEIIISVLSLLFALILFLFLAVNLIVSGLCFYSDALVTLGDSSTFVDTYKTDLNLTDTNIQFIINSCFNEKTANFSGAFNQTNSTSADSDITVITESKRPTTTTNTTTNSTTGTGNTTDNSTGTDSGTGTNSSTDTTSSDSSITIGDGSDITSFRLLAETNSTNSTVTTDTSSELVEVPSTFDTALLSQFQSFVTSYLVYDSFYEETLGSASPSVSSFQKYLINFRDGIFPNFSTYITALSELNSNQIKTSAYTMAMNIRNCDSSRSKTCLPVKETSLATFSARIALDNNIDDKTGTINMFTRLKNSLNSGAELYEKMINDLTSATNAQGNMTPSSSAEKTRLTLLNIYPDMNTIKTTLANSFAIFSAYGGDLSSLTNCYVIKRETMLIEAPVCFLLMPELFSALAYLVLINLVLLLILWGIFCSIKYSGNLTVGSWVSKTTVASAWDKSKGNVLSFYENSEIMVDDESRVTEEEEDDDYFEDSEEEDQDRY